MIEYINGIPLSVPNEIVSDDRSEHYHVSYNGSRTNYGVDTTALVIRSEDNKSEVYYILKGNHSKQFRNCKNLKDCVRYFIANKDISHSYSDKFIHNHLI